MTWGPIDLLASVPALWFASTPVIHTLKWPHVFRIVQGIRAFKAIRAISLAVHANKRSAIVVLGFLIAEVAIIGSCFSVLHFESQDPTANIKNAADVLWWSIVTMSTVGYGDYYPVTVGGRFTAALLMFCGIGLFAMLAGVFADTLRSATVDFENKTQKKTTPRVVYFMVAIVPTTNRRRRMYTEYGRASVRRALAKIRFRRAKHGSRPSVRAEEHCAQPISPSVLRPLPSKPPCSLKVGIDGLPTHQLGLIFALLQSTHQILLR